MEENTLGRGRTVSGNEECRCVGISSMQGCPVHDSRLDLPAIKKLPAVKLVRDSSGWDAVRGHYIVAHFAEEEDARLFVEGVPQLVEELEEAQELAMEMGASSSVQVQDFRDRLLAILGECG